MLTASKIVAGEHLPHVIVLPCAGNLEQYKSQHITTGAQLYHINRTIRFEQHIRYARVQSWTYRLPVTSSLARKVTRISLVYRANKINTNVWKKAMWRNHHADKPEPHYIALMRTGCAI